MNDQMIWVWLILGLSAIGTSVISAVVGMGGGIVLLSIMTFFLPFNILIPVHGIIQLISNATRTYLLRKNIIMPVFWWFLVGLPFGTYLSVSIIKTLDSNTLPLLLIAVLIFYTLFKPKKLPALVIPFWGFSFIGFAVGFLGPLVGATGPAMAPFFLRPDFKKENIIATKSSVQTIGHLIKIPAFLYLGFNYVENAIPITGLTICAVLGTKFGVGLLSKINESLFRKIFRTALFLAGLRLLYKVFIPLVH